VPMAPEPVGATVVPLPRPAKRMQMGDIARLAGVSIATVSRALSGHPAIPAATRDRITELARSVNYQVNVGAASLRKRDVKTVAVCILTDQLQSISDPFILSLLGHIADALDQRGYALLLTRASPEQPDTITHMVENGQAAGVIVIGQFIHPDHLNGPMLRGVPMMVWGASLPSMLYPVVGTDNELGGFLATRHLLEQGCQRVAFLGEHQHPEAELRHAGYKRAYIEMGRDIDPRLEISTPFEPGHTRRHFSEWLDQGHAFDGLFCISDVMAINAIAVMAERGLRVPHHVKVIGYDDVLMASHVHPSITTVRQPVDLAGRALVESLFLLLQGQRPASTVLPTALIVRESSLPPPVTA
jgi:DNA-binding LacI/PurR family transcriptional regulator